MDDVEAFLASSNDSSAEFKLTALILLADALPPPSLLGPGSSVRDGAVLINERAISVLRCIGIPFLASLVDSLCDRQQALVELAEGASINSNAVVCDVLSRVVPTCTLFDGCDFGAALSLARALWTAADSAVEDVSKQPDAAARAITTASLFTAAVFASSNWHIHALSACVLLKSAVRAWCGLARLTPLPTLVPASAAEAPPTPEPLSQAFLLLTRLLLRLCHSELASDFHLFFPLPTTTPPAAPASPSVSDVATTAAAAAQAGDLDTPAHPSGSPFSGSADRCGAVSVVIAELISAPTAGCARILAPLLLSLPLPSTRSAPTEASAAHALELKLGRGASAVPQLLGTALFAGHGSYASACFGPVSADNVGPRMHDADAAADSGPRVRACALWLLCSLLTAAETLTAALPPPQSALVHAPMSLQAAVPLRLPLCPRALLLSPVILPSPTVSTATAASHSRDTFPGWVPPPWAALLRLLVTPIAPQPPEQQPQQQPQRPQQRVSCFVSLSPFAPPPASATGPTGGATGADARTAAAASLVPAHTLRLLATATLTSLTNFFGPALLTAEPPQGSVVQSFWMCAVSKTVGDPRGTPVPSPMPVAPRLLLRTVTALAAVEARVAFTSAASAARAAACAEDRVLAALASLAAAVGAGPQAAGGAVALVAAASVAVPAAATTSPEKDAESARDRAGAAWMRLARKVLGERFAVDAANTVLGAVAAAGAGHAASAGTRADASAGTGGSSVSDDDGHHADSSVSAGAPTEVSLTAAAATTAVMAAVAAAVSTGARAHVQHAAAVAAAEAAAGWYQCVLACLASGDQDDEDNEAAIGPSAEASKTLTRALMRVYGSPTPTVPSPAQSQSIDAWMGAPTYPLASVLPTSIDLASTDTAAVFAAAAALKGPPAPAPPLPRAPPALSWDRTVAATGADAAALVSALDSLVAPAVEWLAAAADTAVQARCRRARWLLTRTLFASESSGIAVSSADDLAGDWAGDPERAPAVVTRAWVDVATSALRTGELPALLPPRLADAAALGLLRVQLAESEGGAPLKTKKAAKHASKAGDGAALVVELWKASADASNGGTNADDADELRALLSEADVWPLGDTVAVFKLSAHCFARSGGFI